MLFFKEEVEVQVDFPIMMYLKVQVDWDGKDYTKLKYKRVENLEEYNALKKDYVFSFKDVTNSVKPKRAPAKNQPKLEV
jgi:hypothetical protein